MGDQEMSDAAQEAAIKILESLPLKDTHLDQNPVAHIFFENDAKTRNALTRIRTSLDRKHKLAFDYITLSGLPSTRTVAPLGMEYWGK